MDFSIIIVNFNTKELLENCLNSIFQNIKADYEVIVVDNASTDGSVEMLAAEFKNRARTVSNQKNLGFGQANNLGAKIANGRFLFFLNSDTIIKENILPALSDFFDRDESIGIISPRLILEDGFKQPNAFGKYPTLKNLIFERPKEPSASQSNFFQVDWVSGAALIIRKEIFQKLGGFDEKFFMYFEDADLCLRAARLGKKIMVFNGAQVTHLVGRSIKKGKIRKNYYYISQNYFFEKHYGKPAMYLLKILRWPYIMFNRTRSRFL